MDDSPITPLGVTTCLSTIILLFIILLVKVGKELGDQIKTETKVIA